MFKGKNILIIKYSSLGDIINALPAVKFLRQNCPEARIYWLLKKEYAGLFSDDPIYDSIIVYAGNNYKAVNNLINKLRSLNVDITIDLQGLLKSALFGYMSGAKARYCFRHTREGSDIFYTKKLGYNRKDVHAVEENLSVIEELLGQRLDSKHDFEITFKKNTIDRARELIKPSPENKNPVIIVSPTSRWQSKMWGQDRFARLSDMLIGTIGARIFFTGTQNDSRYIEDIRQKMKNASVNLAGKTDLKTLAGTIKSSDLVISCDSGAMHLASAMGTPVVAIFGPTNPKQTGPFGKNSVVVSSGADCSPCRKRKCSSLACMNNITPEAVYEKSGELLCR